MNRIRLAMLAAFSLLFLNPTQSRATVHAGDTAPNFTKAELDAPPPAERSLSDYAGKIVILFLLGYS